MNRKIKDYLTVDTLGKSGIELVVKVYDGAISNLREAAESYKKDDSGAGYDCLEKGKKFIVHLYSTLDEAKGGDIADKLARLYAFVIENINRAQATKELSLIEDSVVILNNIREGWVKLAERIKPEGELSDGQPAREQPPQSISMSI